MNHTAPARPAANAGDPPGIHGALRWLATAALVALPAPIRAAAQCQDQVFVPSPEQPAEDFGELVALDRDWAAMDFDPLGGNGVVHVYRRVGDDWVLRQELDLPLSSPAHGLALHGDTLAVRAYGLLIFQLVGDTWKRTGYWPPSELPSSSGLSESKDLALDERRLVVGNDPVLVFERIGDGWTPADRIGDPTPADSVFPGALALDGDRIFLQDVDPGPHALAPKTVEIRVYEKQGLDWRLVASIPNPEATGSNFASSLAADGGRLFVGDPLALGGLGAVYVVESTPSGWGIVQTIPGPVPGGSFGARVRASAGRVLASATTEPTEFGSGRAYWLVRDDAGRWELGETVDPLPVGAVAHFGVDAALSESDLWVRGGDGGDYPLGVAYSFGKSDCEAVIETPPAPVVAWDGASTQIETFWEGEALWEVEDVQQTAGTPLGFEWTLETDGRIRMTIEQPTPTGVATFEFASSETSTSAELEVQGVSPPLLLLGEVDFFLSGVPLDLEVHGTPGAAALLFGSSSPEQSVLPGVLELDLGAGFTNLVLVQSWTVPDVGTGALDVTFAGDGTLKLLPVYLQLVEVGSSPPYAASDSVYGVWLH